MNKLWNYINSRDFTIEGKIRTFLFCTCTIAGIAGFIALIIARCFMQISVEGALCFVGYPIFILGYLGGFIFLCRNKVERH